MCTRPCVRVIYNKNTLVMYEVGAVWRCDVCAVSLRVVSRWLCLFRSKSRSLQPPLVHNVLNLFLQNSDWRDFLFNFHCFGFGFHRPSNEPFCSSAYCCSLTLRLFVVLKHIWVRQSLQELCFAIKYARYIKKFREIVCIFNSFKSCIPFASSHAQIIWCELVGQRGEMDETLVFDPKSRHLSSWIILAHLFCCVQRNLISRLSSQSRNMIQVFAYSSTVYITPLASSYLGPRFSAKLNIREYLEQTLRIQAIYMSDANRKYVECKTTCSDV